MELAHSDGRGNTTTTVTDIAGRPTCVTDAQGNTTTTAYCSCCDQPATVTDAMGNVTHYRYDIRGRKVAEWGTSIQPMCFGYDEADNMVSLTQVVENALTGQSSEGAAAEGERTLGYNTYSEEKTRLKANDSPDWALA